MKINYKFYLIGAFLCLMASQSFAQYMYSQNAAAARAQYHSWLAYRRAKDEGNNLIHWWRVESTFGIAYSGTANFSERNRYDSTRYSSTPSYDTSIKGRAKQLLSFHANENANYMITRLGASSILSISVGGQGDIMRWRYDLFQGNTLTTGSTNLLYIQFGLPVTVDYKWGCDVDFQPEMKTCFAAGAGAMPIAGFSGDGFDHQSSNFAVLPYVYASCGMYTNFLGCLKLRATYYPARVDIFKDLNESIGDNMMTMNMQAGNMFSLGISIMQYSRDWGDGWARRGARSERHPHYHRRSGGMIRM